MPSADVINKSLHVSMEPRESSRVSQIRDQRVSINCVGAYIVASKNSVSWNGDARRSRHRATTLNPMFVLEPKERETLQFQQIDITTHDRRFLHSVLAFITFCP